MRYHFTLIRIAISKKSTNSKCWRGGGEKGSLTHCWWECKLVQPLWRTVWRFLKKLKIELPYDPAFQLLGICPEKTIIWNNICTPMFIAALFTIARISKQPRSPQWQKNGYRKCGVCIYNGLLLSHNKESLWVSFNEVDEPKAYYTK